MDHELFASLGYYLHKRSILSPEDFYHHEEIILAREMTKYSVFTRQNLTKWALSAIFPPGSDTQQCCIFLSGAKYRYGAYQNPIRPKNEVCYEFFVPNLNPLRALNYQQWPANYGEITAIVCT